MQPTFNSSHLLGIDLSHFEPAVDWSLAKEKVSFLYTKATQGLGFVDPSLKLHMLGAQHSGVPATAYHFMEAHYTGEDQARFFLDTLSKADVTCELPPVLDWEEASACGMTSAHQQRVALAWLKMVQDETGRTPLIYSGHAFMQELNVSADFSEFPLILARYKAPNCPTVKPWDRIVAWQYTETGIVPGLAAGHTVDCNVFYGTIEELRAL